MTDFARGGYIDLGVLRECGPTFDQAVVRDADGNAVGVTASVKVDRVEVPKRTSVRLSRSGNLKVSKVDSRWEEFHRAFLMAYLPGAMTLGQLERGDE